MRNNISPEEILQRKHKVNSVTLKVLLVMSFIDTGLYLISELMSGIMLPWMTEYAEAHPELLPDQWGILLERALSIPQWYYLLCAVLDAASFAGLVLMWHLRKNGFHCYALAKLLLMLMPMLFLGRSFVGVGNIMIGVFFIAYYFFLMKSLGTFDPKSVQPDTTDTQSTEDTSDSTEADD